MYMPVPVYSEPEAVKKHADELSSFGRRCLIITGRSSSRINGSLKDVTEALKSHGISYHIFDDIEENPSVETVMRAVVTGAEVLADHVIGVGGGSPLDAAKAVAFMLAHPGADAGLLYTAGDDHRLPLVLVPTTCGTGSEVTQYSVLTRTLPSQTRTKKSISHSIFADLALIDGKYLKTAPISVLRSTAVDALSHMAESYINTRADDLSRMFVRSGLELWKGCRKVLDSGRAEPEELQRLMNASAMAGMAIAQTSTTVPHGLSYALTLQKNIPHGAAVGYFLGGYIRLAGEEVSRYLFSAAGFRDAEDYRRWYLDSFELPEIPEELLMRSVDDICKTPHKLSAVPYAPDREALLDIAFFSDCR